MRVSLRVTILLLFLSYIRHVESKLYTRSDAISSSAPILSSYFGARSSYGNVSFEPFRVEPGDWSCGSCPPRYVGDRNVTNLIAVGDTGDCYKCGFQSFSLALAEQGVAGWIRFTKNSLDFDYLKMYKPGYEYRTFWFHDVGENVDLLSNFLAVVGTSHELLDWFENDAFEEQTVRLTYEQDHDENHFVNLWDSPFFILLQFIFFCWSIFNIVLSVVRS